MGSKLVCGIDLGTTNSVLSVIAGDKPVAVPVEDGSPLVPSVISYDADRGQILVGRKARNRMAAYPELTARSIKRRMGQDVRIELGEISLRPEEASSHIVRYLVEEGSRRLKKSIEEVVITVPAYFDDAQRRATIAAGELAGVRVARIINEPTAAALYFTHLDLHRGGKKERVLVYDLGGGTFDVSVVEIRGELREVLASCGDTQLGGDDFDERVEQRLLHVLREAYGRGFWEKDRLLRYRLREIAERAKVELSRKAYVQISEVALGEIEGEPINLDYELSRMEFESLTEDLLGRTLEKVEEALGEAALAPEDIDAVVLAGGCTRMPAIQEALSQFFERPIAHLIDPDLCVSYGAAIQSGLVSGEPLGHILIDVTAHTLGVATSDNIHPDTGKAEFFSPIIRRNTRIPVTRSQVYYTVEDQQENALIEVYQGESEFCSENTLVGRFSFPLEPAPAGSLVVIEFSYDREGVVHVAVEQKGYGNRKEVTVDIRGRRVVERPEGAGRAEKTGPVNYIAGKVHQILNRGGLPPDLEAPLRESLARYETAVREEVDEEEIDALEDELLDLLDQLEE